MMKKEFVDGTLLLLIGTYKIELQPRDIKSPVLKKI